MGRTTSGLVGKARSSPTASSQPRPPRSSPKPSPTTAGFDGSCAIGSESPSKSFAAPTSQIAHFNGHKLAPKRLRDVRNVGHVHGSSSDTTIAASVSPTPDAFCRLSMALIPPDDFWRRTRCVEAIAAQRGLDVRRHLPCLTTKTLTRCEGHAVVLGLPGASLQARSRPQSRLQAAARSTRIACSGGHAR